MAILEVTDRVAKVIWLVSGKPFLAVRTSKSDAILSHICEDVMAIGIFKMLVESCVFECFFSIAIVLLREQAIK